MHPPADLYKSSRVQDASRTYLLSPVARTKFLAPHHQPRSVSLVSCVCSGCLKQVYACLSVYLYAYYIIAYV